MIHKIVLAALMSLSFGTIATAQDYDWRVVLSQAGTQQLLIDTAFEDANDRPSRLHFSMDVPASPDNLILRSRYPKAPGNLGELLFLSPDEQVLEYVTFSTGTAGGETPDEQLESVYAVIQDQIYPSLSPPETANVLGGRKVEIAGHPAIEFVSLFDHPTYGPIAARIVGVIAPDNTSVFFLVQQSVRGILNLSGPDELARTFAGTMLSTITFQAYRDEAGELVSF